VRVVIDPNVFISAALSNAGPPWDVLLALTRGRFDLVLSPLLLAELHEVLSREKFRRWLTLDEVDTYISVIESLALLVDDPPGESSVSPDPKDDYLIFLARASGADYLVSGDHHLTDLTFDAPQIVTPRAFLSLTDVA
jgi:uncharacterized protein